MALFEGKDITGADQRPRWFPAALQTLRALSRSIGVLERALGAAGASPESMSLPLTVAHGVAGSSP